MRRASLLVMLLSVTAFAQPVAFQDIAGARMAVEGRWLLALGAPPAAGVHVHIQPVDLAPGAPTPLLTVPEDFAGSEFTVLLSLSQVTPGVLRLTSPAVAGDVRAALVSREGRLAVRFGPADAAGDLPLLAEATATMRVEQVTVYRSFDQLFGQGGRVLLTGAAYHKLGDDPLRSPPVLPGSYFNVRAGLWNTPPSGEEDGIGGARLEDHYRALLAGPLQDEAGLAVPVRAPRGVMLTARLKGGFAFVVYPEVAEYQLTWAGEPNRWTTALIPLDGAVLDGSANGIFTGRKKLDWATGKTWVDNYGTGFVDFVALLPQNEIPVPEPTPSRLVMDYEAAEGSRALTVELPPGTVGVALVHAGPGATDVFVRGAEGYRPAASVTDGAHLGFLAVRAGAMRFEP